MKNIKTRTFVIFSTYHRVENNASMKNFPNDMWFAAFCSRYNKIMVHSNCFSSYT